MDHSHHSHDHGGGETATATATGMYMGPCNMVMLFHTEYMYDCVMFEKWMLTSVGGLIGSIIGVFLLAIIYEALKYYREYLFKQSHVCANYSAVTGSDEAPKVVQGMQQSVRKRILSINHFAQTGLHIVQVTLSYFLMLIFMTYNVYLCVAVVAGAGVGFFIFGWKKTIVVDITEHCH